MKWFQLLKKYFWPRSVTYTGIDDLPQFYWNEITKDADLSLLVISGKPTVEYLIELWHKIFDEFVSEIGLDKTFIERLKRKKKIILLRYQYVQTKQRHLITLINIEEALLKQKDQESDFTYRDSIISMSKYMGYRIDEKTIPVAEYHSIVKSMLYVGSNKS